MNYYAVLTALGAQKLAAAFIAGIRLEIHAMAVGDGGGDYVEPSDTFNALVGEIYRANKEEIIVAEGDQPTQFSVTAVVPRSAPAFVAREASMYLEDGTLLAYAALPPTPKAAGGTLTVTIVVQTHYDASQAIALSGAAVGVPAYWVDQNFMRKRSAIVEISSDDFSGGALLFPEIPPLSMLVLNAPSDVFLFLPGALLTGWRGRVRNRGDGGVWLIPLESGSVLEGDGNYLPPGRTAELLLEVSSAEDHRWLSMGSALQEQEMPEPPDPPAPPDPPTGSELLGNDGEPLELNNGDTLAVNGE